MSFLKKFSNAPIPPEETVSPAKTVDGIASFEETDDTTTYFLSGRIDVNNYESVQKELLQTQKKNVVLDASQATYLSSAGLKMLLEVKKVYDEKNITHNIINMTENVYRILKMTGYTSILNVTKIEE